MFSRLYIIPDLGDRKLDKLMVRDVQTWVNGLRVRCQCCFQGKDAARPEPECCALGSCCHEVASDWTMQRLADLLAAPVDRPVVLETTALGAAWLAGHKAGVWPGQEGFAERWRLERRFEPDMTAAERSRRLGGWRDAVRRTLTTG